MPLNFLSLPIAPQIDACGKVEVHYRMPSDLGAVYISDVECLSLAFDSDPNLKMSLTREALKKQFPDVDLKFDQLAIKVCDRPHVVCCVVECEFACV